MTFLQRRPLIPLPVVLIGILLGRLAVRAVLNLLPGAPCLGGTFCERNEKGRKEGSAHVGLIHTGVFLAAFIASAAVRMTFGAVGPSCFCPEDRGCFGLDQSGEAAALGGTQRAP